MIAPASEKERAQVADLAAQVQTVTGQIVGLAYADQGYIGDEPAMFALAYLAVLRTRNGGEKGGANAQLDLTAALLPLTIPEIRHVLWALGQASLPGKHATILRWSDWRRRHQAHARRCHYKHRLALS